MKQTEYARLENIQYKAAKIVTGALHLSNREKLNDELGWESILERGNFLSVNIFHKIHLYERRPLIRNCMPKVDLPNNFNLRNKSGYVPFQYKGEKFNNSFFPNTTKIWNKLPSNIQCQNTEEFKNSTIKCLNHIDINTFLGAQN